MDEIALRYLLLGLRLGRQVRGFVHSYTGPAELAEAVNSEPVTPAAELHDEAMQLAGLAAELSGETAADRRRTVWLEAQLKAMGALARRAGGEEIGYVDLVEELYDVEVQLEPDATFTTARAMLDRALPGRATLRDRLATHDAGTRIQPGQAIGAISELAGRLRTRTRAQLWLPDDELIRFEGARDVPWDADGRYLGSGRSIVRVNLDRPLTFAWMVELAAHDAYPGHHAEASVKEELLVSAGNAELGLITTLSPQTLVSEGTAAAGREVVMSDQELGLELQRLAKSVDQKVDIEATLTVQRARRLLIPALGNAAVALHRDGEPTEQVRAYLAEVALVGDERLDAEVSDLTDAILSTEPFTHIEGRRLVSEWLETQGQTHGYGRLLAEQLTPRTLRSELVPR